jgi:hypothetical protein
MWYLSLTTLNKGAAASAALYFGANITEILAAAHWKHAMTFQQFYSLGRVAKGAMIPSAEGITNT